MGRKKKDKSNYFTTMVNLPRVYGDRRKVLRVGWEAVMKAGLRDVAREKLLQAEEAYNKVRGVHDAL